MLVVVLPQPPFWLMIATVRMAQTFLGFKESAAGVGPSTKNNYTQPADSIGGTPLKTLDYGAWGRWGGDAVDCGQVRCSTINGA